MAPLADPRWAMTGLEGAILGLVQGLTEFLPISSSGHLVVGQTLFGLAGSHLAFDVVVHGATLLAIAVFFRERIVEVIRRRDWEYAGKIVLGTSPIVATGLLLREVVEKAFANPAVVAACLAGTGMVLLSLFFRPGRRESDSISAGDPAPSWGAAWWIGCAQAIALFPGVSRSGTTITTALWLGVAPRPAAEFSFLLGIPAIAGAVVLQLGAIARAGAVGAAGVWPMVFGGTVAFFSGLVAIVLVFRFLARRTFPAFGFYCLAFAGAFGIWLALA